MLNDTERDRVTRALESAENILAACGDVLSTDERCEGQTLLLRLVQREVRRTRAWLSVLETLSDVDDGFERALDKAGV